MPRRTTEAMAGAGRVPVRRRLIGALYVCSNDGSLLDGRVRVDGFRLIAGVPPAFSGAHTGGLTAIRCCLICV